MLLHTPVEHCQSQYSVIQRECPAIVFALKQFKHYLLGRTFKLVTDHAALQWLSSQKMEGLLARWALATQKFDFTITYRKGVEHGNADGLSRQCTNHNATVGHIYFKILRNLNINITRTL